MTKARVFNRYRIDGPTWKIGNVTGNATDFYLYDEIGFFGTTAADFVAAIDSIKTDKINLRINSPGGDVFDGIAMANIIARDANRFTTYIDGLAASAATYPALASGKVKIGRNAFVMIHDPWSISSGTASDHRTSAGILDKVHGQIVDVYASRTRRPVSEIRRKMAEETWFTAQEAVDFGLADGVAESPTARNHFDLSVFSNVPEQLRDAAPSADKITSIKDFEVFLRDAGFSRSTAKTIASCGFKESQSEQQRDAAESESDASKPESISGVDLQTASNRLQLLSF